MRDIKPAHTAEQWESVRIAGALACLKTLTIGFESSLDGSVTHERPTPEQYRHAIAAVALDGQPFGFTEEDVVVLRNCSCHARGWASILADRIEALLPPEN